MTQKMRFSAWSEVAELAYNFEHGLIQPDSFHHREHLAVAFYYSLSRNEEETHAKMRAALQNFLSRHGLPAGYHETITKFWVKRIMTHIAHIAQPLSDAHFLVALNNLLAQNSNPKLIKCYYTQATLASDEARNRWVAPDLQAL
jgi:hypothetical protein